MSALDAIGGRMLVHPISGEVIEFNDLVGIKAALSETEDYLRRPEVRRMWNARDALQTRRAELEPMALPRPSNQTDKQRRVARCPRCGDFLPSEPEPSVQPEPQVGANPARGADNLDAAGPASSGSVQSELLPQGPRSAEQDAALGLSVFGEKLESPEPLPQDPAQEAASTSQDAPAPREGEAGGASPSSPIDPIVVQAGEVTIPKGKRAGRTVADVAQNDPGWCLWYLRDGLTESLKAAITTYLYAVKPELMEGK